MKRITNISFFRRNLTACKTSSRKPTKITWNSSANSQSNQAMRGLIQCTKQNPATKKTALLTTTSLALSSSSRAIRWVRQARLSSIRISNCLHKANKLFPTRIGVYWKILPFFRLTKNIILINTFSSSRSSVQCWCWVKNSRISRFHTSLMVESVTFSNNKKQGF